MRDRLLELQANGNATTNTNADAEIIQVDTENRKSNRLNINYLDPFFTHIEDLKQQLNRIENNTRMIIHIQTELLTKVSESELKKNELINLMNDVTDISRNIQSNLQKIDKKINSKISNINLKMDCESRMKRAQYNALLKRFTIIMENYNNNQSSYREKCEVYIRKQLKILNKEISSQEIEELIDSHNPCVFSNYLFNDNKNNSTINRQTLELNEIEQRHKDIIQLEDNLLEIQDMFISLAKLIDDQGSVIDRIDVQVSLAKDYVIQGEKQVQQTIILRTKSRKKKCLLICILIAAIVLVVVFVVTAFIVIAINLSIKFKPFL